MEYKKYGDCLLLEGKCEDAISLMKKKEVKVTGIITSPPYNTSRSGRSDPLNRRYIGYNDSMSNEEYIDWQVGLFREFDNILEIDGCILLNLSYSSENTDTIWLLVAGIIQNTPFTTSDHIVWKKKSAIPNNRSKNKLTRITESIFVFCRKTEKNTFNANKQVVSIIEKTKQKNYKNTFNFIEADNSDKGPHKLEHKATFSTDLITKLIDIYFPKGSKLFDPFMGTGTVGLSCVRGGLSFIGSEVNKTYFDISCERVKGEML